MMLLLIYAIFLFNKMKPSQDETTIEGQVNPSFHLTFSVIPSVQWVGFLFEGEDDCLQDHDNRYKIVWSSLYLLNFIGTFMQEIMVTSG